MPYTAPNASEKMISFTVRTNDLSCVEVLDQFHTLPPSQPIATARCSVSLFVFANCPADPQLVPGSVTWLAGQQWGEADYPPGSITGGLTQGHGQDGRWAVLLYLGEIGELLGLDW